MEFRRSLLCLSVTEQTIDEAAKVVDRYRNLIDMVELRADYLNEDEYTYISRFPKLSRIESILTIRRKRDGGLFSGNEEARAALFKKVLEHNGLEERFSYVDFEEDFSVPILDELASKKGIRIIRSFHDFNGIPDDIVSAVKNLGKKRGDIPKLAIYPTSTRELLSIINASRKLTGMEKILIGMGEYGIITRILASLLGSYLTFVSIPGKSAAPGHLNVEEITNLYRFKKIDGETKIVGVIGNPIMHTLSPFIHNTGIRNLNLNAVYLPFLVDDLEVFFEMADKLGISGFSVTVPHKLKVIKHLDEVDESVVKIGACNTVYREGGKWWGTNTDADGFIAPLRDFFGFGDSNVGQEEKFRKFPGIDEIRATIIGAGGAARAVAYALWREGVRFVVLNRTLEKAKELALQYGMNYGGLDENGLNLMDSYNDLIVQATRVGMEPNTEDDPFPNYTFKGGEVVYDLVYKPEITKFLSRAMDKGCRIIGGKRMLFEQAKMQFKIFMKRDFPLLNLKL